MGTFPLALITQSPFYVKFAKIHTSIQLVDGRLAAYNVEKNLL
jgi:hypothetical protein